ARRMRSNWIGLPAASWSSIRVAICSALAESPSRVTDSTIVTAVNPSGMPSTHAVTATASSVASKMRRRTPHPVSLRTSRLRVDAESDTAHRSDRALRRPAVAIGELRPQPGHVHVEGLTPLALQVAPHLGDDLLSGHHLTGAQHQDPQQLELLVGQRDLDTV